MQSRIQSSQGELPLITPQPDRQVNAEDLELVVRTLQGRGWMLAEEIAAKLGPGWNDRKVRAVCSAAVPGVLSYPGSKGYKLWAEATVEEIDHAINAIERQANEMTQRAFHYRRAYHARFRG